MVVPTQPSGPARLTAVPCTTQPGEVLRASTRWLPVTAPNSPIIADEFCEGDPKQAARKTVGPNVGP
jgi:hypothetical protein